MKTSLTLVRIVLAIAISSAVASARPTQSQNVPPSGTTVVVRMIDAVNSGSDAAGKQYHASVTKAVNAGNGATITQGADATVTLARNGSGWAAQLSSVVINGQAVAVTSSSANLTGAAQSAASTMSSVLGGFGKPKSIPSSVSPVATGQQVILPPGTALNFVLGAMAPSSAPATATSSVATAITPAASAPPASGQMYYTLCRYQGQKDGHPIMYVTPIIHTDEGASTISTAYIHYIEATYDLSKLKFGSGYCKEVSSSVDQQNYTMTSLEKQWAASKTEVIHVDWTYTPAQAAAANAAVATAAATPTATPTLTGSGLYLYCSSDPEGSVIYFSDFFLADPDPSRQRGVSFHNVTNAYNAFLKQKYAFNSGSNYPTGCSNAVNNAAGQRYAQTHKQNMEDQYRQQKKQIVETGWKYTPDPAAAAPAAPLPAHPHH